MKSTEDRLNPSPRSSPYRVTVQPFNHPDNPPFPPKILTFFHPPSAVRFGSLFAQARSASLRLSRASGPRLRQSRRKTPGRFPRAAGPYVRADHSCFTVREMIFCAGGKLHLFLHALGNCVLTLVTRIRVRLCCRSPSSKERSVERMGDLHRPRCTGVSALNSLNSLYLPGLKQE